VETFQQGLRCQDVHSGLRNADPNSPLLGPLADTRVVATAQRYQIHQVPCRSYSIVPLSLDTSLRSITSTVTSSGSSTIGSSTINPSTPLPISQRSTQEAERPILMSQRPAQVSW
jgi:hypothetical protein